MDILCYSPRTDAALWMQGIKERLQEANIRMWQPGDNAPADYAMVRLPPPEMLKGRISLKGIFSLSAGVDDILAALRENPGMLPESVPLFRLEDAGMGIQMAEYATHWVLGWYRRFGDYQDQKIRKEWMALDIPPLSEFAVGILGAGVLAMSVLKGLKPWGFPLRCWSRSLKHIDGVISFHGHDQLPTFLHGTRVLINLLPDTPQTKDIINRKLLKQLEPQSFVMNLARGAQLVEEDLLAALEAGEVKAAALDVFKAEPLPASHPFWTHPRIAITAHSSAKTIPEASFDYLVEGIRTLEAGGMPRGRVDIKRGY